MLDEELLDCAMLAVDTVIRDIVRESETTGRIKSAEAVSKKLRRNDTNVRPLHDKVGVRVIVETVNECFTVIDHLHATMRCLDEFYDDYITRPKENGYQSLHTTVHGSSGLVFEVQVRTREMHAHSEEGAAAHRLYKRQQSTDNQEESLDFVHYPPRVQAKGLDSTATHEVSSGSSQENQ